MMSGKRGQEELLSVIIQLVIVTLFLVILVYFINSAVSGILTKDQMSAKSLALIIDSAKPNTVISITSETELSIEGNKASAKSDKIPYEYDFYSPYTFDFKKREGGVYILTIK